MREKPFRVLFVGNSFIFVHDLPGLLVHVSKSLGRDVQVANSTIGGCTLYAQTAASSARTAALLHERWDAIVLQEYSALPLVAKARDKYLRPAIRAFRACTSISRGNASGFPWPTSGKRQANIWPVSEPPTQ